MLASMHLERDTVIGSNYFGLDDYIKTYLFKHSDISFNTAIKIILRYYATPELILQLTEFKNHLKTVNFCLFMEVFGKAKTKLVNMASISEYIGF